MPVLRLVTWGEPEAEAAVARLRNRFLVQLSAASTEVHEKTRAIFGEPLTPLESVRRIVEAVRTRGDEAVLEWARRLDGLELRAEELRVPEAELAEAPARIDPDLWRALQTAAANIRRFQEQIRNPDPPLLNLGDRRLGVISRPVASTGIYAPGGTAAYPSTILMTAVPAQVAGVPRRVLVCLPGRNGRHLPVLLAAARLAGVDEVYRIGGPYAIAALAYGTQTIPKVDLIVGPGSLFVTLAKREILGAAGIDLLAGPSEILILADETAPPAWIAADLLSQTEHDPLASSVLVTPCRDLAEAVVQEVEAQLAQLPRSELARAALRDYGLAVRVPDLAEGIRLANELAPEHVEVLCRHPAAVAAEITQAGALFLGPQTPEPVGDYLAGPSHVLPTGGTARFCSALSVNDFLKRTSLLEYSAEALRQERSALARLARAEGLEAHARSVEIRGT